MFEFEGEILYGSPLTNFAIAQWLSFANIYQFTSVHHRFQLFLLCLEQLEQIFLLSGIVIVSLTQFSKVYDNNSFSFTSA